MGLRDFKNEIMWNCVITGNVLCAELYTSSRNTIISNETCRYIIPGCYTKRTSEIEIILQENRNRYARDTHLFPRPTIVKNTPLIYLLSWIIMYSIQSFFKIRKSDANDRNVSFDRSRYFREKEKRKKESVPSNVIRRGACGSPTLISPLVSLDTRYAL